MTNAKVQQKYPHVASAIDRVAQIVAALRTTPHGELEARFGLLTKDGFVAGVSRQCMERMISLLQSSPRVTSSDEWAEEQDFFFGQYRTRVAYDSSTMEVCPTTIQKRRVDSAVMTRPCTSDGVDIRVALKDEAPVRNVPACVTPSAVRIKQRRKFRIHKFWELHFTLAWSGRTKTEAENAQSTKDPVFEVECELVNTEECLAQYNDARIAAALMLHMHALVDDPSSTLYSVAS